MKCLLGVMKRPFRDTNVEHLRVTCMLFCPGFDIGLVAPLRYSSLILLLLYSHFRATIGSTRIARFAGT
jgi:hypothetical protein